MPMVPTYAFIDRATGYFNTAMNFKKDYAAILSFIYDLDRAIDNFLTDPESDSYTKMKELGIDNVDYNDEDEKHRIMKHKARVLEMVNKLPSSLRRRFLMDGDIVS